MNATFLAYYVANRSMETSQASINTTGNNISNINTEGYTRQRVDIVSMYNSTTSRYADKSLKTGLGSKATGVSQLRDPYLDARYRAQNSETSKYSTISNALSNLEDVFDEATTEALQGQLSDFLTDLQSLSQSPTSADIEQVVRSSAQKVTSIINMYANEIEQVKTQQVEDLTNTVNDDVNVVLENIAQLSKQIREAQVYGDNANELKDQRNLLVDELSGYANIKVTTSPQQITDDLTIENYEISIVDESGNKTYLVYNDLYNQLSLSENATTGEQEIFVTNDIATDPNASIEAQAMINDPTTSINDEIIEGSMGGMLDVINGKGSFAAGTENDFRGIAYYEEAMNIFSQTFADIFNGLNGLGDTTVAPLFTTEDGTSTTGITAANIQISDEWTADGSFIVTTDGSTGGAGQADNVLRMVAAMSDDQTFLEDDGTTTFFEGSFHEYMNGILGELANDVEQNGDFSETADTVLTTIFTSRESVAGVSLNEEGTYLMAYQKCYNAAVRFFTVIDENVDKIINSMGRAGL
ncbi:flagellar hook-associated protein FlgK [Eubacteriaceae bacterium ES3]|nr:flagellar hook-associated protein FlgK [Eubacteriaceae bacterium ES3]